VVTTIPGGGGVRAILIRATYASVGSPNNWLFLRRPDCGEAKLYSMSADSVPTPPFKLGVVGLQETCSPEAASNSEDFTDSDREGRPWNMAKQHTARSKDSLWDDVRWVGDS